MARKFTSMITKRGTELIAAAILNQAVIEIDEGAVGDGGGAEVIPRPEMTRLVQEKWRGKLSALTIDPADPHKVWVQMVIPPDIGGFTIREIGIFAKGELVGYASYPASYKPVPDEGAFGDFEIQMQFVVSSTEHIQVIIDPHVVVATKEDVEKHNRDENAHGGHFRNYAVHIIPAACTYDSGKKLYTLKPELEIGTSGFCTVRFKTPSAYVSGAKFQVGAKTYTPKLSSSDEAVPANIFLAGRTITAHLDMGSGIITIPAGGGSGGVLFGRTAPAAAEDKKKLWVCTDTAAELYNVPQRWDGTEWTPLFSVWA